MLGQPLLVAFRPTSWQVARTSTYLRTQKPLLLSRTRIHLSISGKSGRTWAEMSFCNSNNFVKHAHSLLLLPKRLNAQNGASHCQPHTWKAHGFRHQIMLLAPGDVLQGRLLEAQRSEQFWSNQEPLFSIGEDCGAASECSQAAVSTPRWSACALAYIQELHTIIAIVRCWWLHAMMRKIDKVPDSFRTNHSAAWHTAEPTYIFLQLMLPTYFFMLLPPLLRPFLRRCRLWLWVPCLCNNLLAKGAHRQRIRTLVLTLRQLATSWEQAAMAGGVSLARLSLQEQWVRRDFRETLSEDCFFCLCHTHCCCSSGRGSSALYTGKTCTIWQFFVL